MSRYSRNIILTKDDLARRVDYYLQQDAFVFDVETTGAYRNVPVKNKVVWISFATHGDAFVLPLGHPIGDHIVGYTKEPRTGPSGQTRNYTVPVWADPPQQLMWSDVLEILEPLFFSKLLKGGHNVPFDLASVAKYYGGRPPAPRYYDTLVGQWLLNENIVPRGLKDLVKRYYGVVYDKENVGRQIEKFPFYKVARYGYMDARETWLLQQRQQEDFLDQPELKVVRELEQDIIEVVVDMNLTGAPIDVAHVEELEEEFADRLVAAEAAIYKAAGRRFNVNSVPQKAEVLYSPKSRGGQGLKVLKTTDKGAPSTDSKALEPHAANPVVQALGKYQEVDKLLNTYVRSWLHAKKDRPPQIVDGRIHARFNQAGADTGRFSSSAPNLQNVPARSEEGKRLRQAFVAPDGYKLLVADYDQIELRILAHYVGPGRLLEAFERGEDPHAATAAAIYGIDISEVTKPQRDAGKGGNFSVVYGTGPETLAAAYKLKLGVAKHFLAEHPKLFPEIYRFKEKVWSVCRSRKPPYVQTILGRKRRLPEIHSRNNYFRSRAERQAVNSIIQGGNADITKMAMVELYRRGKEIDGFHLIMTVHDELISLCPADRVEEGAQIVREAMTGPHIAKLMPTVPITTDVKIVDNWADAK